MITLYLKQHEAETLLVKLEEYLAEAEQHKEEILQSVKRLRLTRDHILQKLNEKQENQTTTS